MSMKGELYRCIESIDKSNLSEDDKDDLLRFFIATKNPLIRNQIAFIFSDVHFDKAVPYIIEKINDRSTFNANGSLVYALESFDMKEHFVALVEIICKQDYEARLMAYGIVKDLCSSVAHKEKTNALKILKNRLVELEHDDTVKGENSALHFVEKTIEIVLASLRED